jgi:hypothetical protein
MIISKVEIEIFTRDIYVTDMSLKSVKVELEYDLALNFKCKIGDIIYLKGFKYYQNIFFTTHISDIFSMPNFLIPLHIYDEFLNFRRNINQTLF